MAVAVRMGMHGGRNEWRKLMQDGEKKPMTGYAFFRGRKR
jgi:hypothetical protein